jgi:hypothetical protein
MILTEHALVWPIDPVPASILALALAALWAVAGVHKLRDVKAFSSALAAYALLRPPMVAIAARVLPLIEIALAVGVLLSASRRVAALGSASLLGLYAAAIAINLWRGRRQLDCGCLGFGPRPRSTISAALLWRNAALLLASLAVGFLPRSVRALDWVDLFTVAAGTAAIGLLYAAAEGLAGAAGRLPRGAAGSARG